MKKPAPNFPIDLNWKARERASGNFVAYK
ncbi:MAG: hypothetical protein RLZZ358_761, partial [Bacteroidota bacterium]